MTTHQASSDVSVRANRVFARPHRRMGLGILLAMTLLATSPAFIQGQSRTAAPPKEATAKKSRGRLPAYFSSLVSQKQRDAIYKIQADYESQVEKLQSQIASLIAERDREVDAVLDADQLSEVTKKREAARQKREARNAAKAEAKANADENADG